MTAARRTTCPFCLNGCESEVTFDYQYRMEYPRDAAVNQGRLCPRGNSASIVLDHPRRLSYPLLEGREVSWDKALGYCREALAAAGPDGLAVVYSRGVAKDELRAVAGFAGAAGTGRLVCGYLEPANAFGVRLAGVRAASIDDVRGAETVLLVGDVFSTSPVAAGPILDARYADRKNRLVVVDSLRTQEAGFAHLFLRVRPGTEPFVLAAIAAILDAKLAGVDVDRSAAVAGVEPGMVEAAADMLKGRSVFVGSTMALGRTSLPMEHGLASQLVALAAGGTFTGFGEARVPPGPMEFAALRADCGQGKVRAIFWFGGLHPLSYAGVFPEAVRAKFRVATSIFTPAEPQPGLVLPVPSELEKESTGESYWGAVNRQALAGHWSGSRTIDRILGDLGFSDAADIAAGPSVRPEDALARVAAAGAPVAPTLALVGEKRAIGIGGFFDGEETLQVSAGDAVRLGLAAGRDVTAITVAGQAEFRANVSDAVPDGVVAVGVNRHAGRALFPLVDLPAGGTSIPPVAVELRTQNRPAEAHCQRGRA
jgi:hypothetical protein